MLRGKMFFTIFLAITGLIAVWAQSDSGCPAVRIEGTNIHRGSCGRYEILPTAECSNRNVYKQNGGDRYIFYMEGDNRWRVGPYLCNTTVHLYVTDSSIHPENIKEHWRVWNSALDSFTENPLLEVKCDSGFQGCSDLSLSGSTIHESYNGHYRVLPVSEMCFGRYTYKHILKNNYIHAGSSWFVGPVNCERYGIKFDDGAFYPENIKNVALEYIGADNHTASPAKIMCYGLSTQELTSSESSITVSQMATTEVSSDQKSSQTTAVKNLEPIEGGCPVAWHVITGCHCQSFCGLECYPGYLLYQEEAIQNITISSNYVNVGVAGHPKTKMMKGVDLEQIEFVRQSMKSRLT